MKRVGLLVLALLAAGVAGCLGDADPADPDGEDPPDEENATATFERMLADGDEHDHHNPTQHEASYNTRLLDHLPLSPENGSGTHALALHEEEDLLFAASTIRGDHGFYAIDVANPSDMSVVGEWHDERAVGGDRAIAVTEDRQWAVLGTEGDLEAEEANVWLFDVSDPTDPTMVHREPLYGGAHTVDTLQVDGTTYVYALSAGVGIYRVAETPTGPELVKVGQYDYAGEPLTEPPDYENPSDYSSWALRSAYAHDMVPIVDEERGPLLYVAYAYQGLQILDVSQPEAPQLVAEWTPPDGEHTPWYVHGVDAATVDDRRVIVVGSEVFEDRHADVPSPVWILDGSELENPELVTTWTNPAGVGSQNILFSAHFFQLDQGNLHLSHYHGGTWTLDLSTQARQEDPRVLGAYLPSADTGFQPDTQCCLGFNLAALPITMDAVGDGSVTYAADLHTGVYAIENTELAS